MATKATLLRDMTRETPRPVDQLNQMGFAMPDAFTASGPSVAVPTHEASALAFPAHSGFAVGLVEAWKGAITDEEHTATLRLLCYMAESDLLPLSTQSENGDLPLMQGQTVPDPNRFVRLTVERIKHMGEKLGEQKYSGRPVLGGRGRDLVEESLVLACLHLEAVAAWYFG